MRLVALVLLACCVVALPTLAHAGCGERRNRTAEKAFGDSWAADAPCRGEPDELGAGGVDWRDDEEPPLRRTMGIAGMGAGAAMLGSGGALVLSSVFLAEGSTPQKVTRYGGIGFAVAGGALFLTGAILTLIDVAAAPAPTPDGRGGQLVAAFTF